MNREEVRELLINISAYDVDNKNIVKQEAMELAIKALEQESCEYAVSLDAVIGVFDTWWAHNHESDNAIEILEDKLNALPPVTPAEKVGRWIYGEDNLGGTGRDGWYCNQCGHFEFWDYSMDMKSAKLNLPNFCPNCGKKMEVEE